MYPASEAYKALIKKESRALTVRGRITFKNNATVTLNAQLIAGITLQEDIGEHLPLGSVSAAKVTLRLDNRQGEWNRGGGLLGQNSFDGAELLLESGVKGADGYEYCAVGRFVLEEAVSQEQELVITVSGADYLANKAETAFLDDLEYPCTVVSLLRKACEIAGISLKTTAFINADTVLQKAIKWEENTSCRAVIGYVACLAAGFARIDRDGGLEIIALKRNDDMYTLTPSHYIQFKRQGVSFGDFNALSVYPFGAPQGYGATRIARDLTIIDNALNSVAIRGNPILAYKYPGFDAMIENMRAGLDGLQFDGGHVRWPGDLSLCAGDFLQVQDLKGEMHKILVMQQSIRLHIGFGMESENRIESETKGKAKTAHTKVFTPTGKLNATALEGDINIRAGQQVNILAGGKIVLHAEGEIRLSSGDEMGEFADETKERLQNAEMQLAPEAIVQTVRTSKNYLDDLNGKLNADALDGYATENYVETAKSTAIQQSAEQIRLEINSERTRAERVEGEIKRFTDTAQSYFDFRIDGLKIGKLGSKFYTLTGDERMGFYENGIEVAYIQHNKLYINSAEILQKLTIGQPGTGLVDLIADSEGLKGAFRR